MVKMREKTPCMQFCAQKQVQQLLCQRCWSIPKCTCLQPVIPRLLLKQNAKNAGPI